MQIYKTNSNYRKRPNKPGEGRGGGLWNFGPSGEGGGLWNFGPSGGGGAYLKFFDRQRQNHTMSGV